MNFNQNIWGRILVAIMTILFLVQIFNFSNSLFAKDEPSEVKEKPQTLTVMTYNLENLFDTLDDPGKDDETYLPLKVKQASPELQKKCHSLKKKEWKKECLNLDWSEKVLQSKMKRIADVILKSNKDNGPDILILQEVENINVLEMLRTQHLSKYYPHKGLLIEGPDKRGIDVAILSKLINIKDPKLHLLKFTAENDLPKNKLPKTRGILEANFSLPDTSNLHVFAVHFPSQGTPSPARKQALKQLHQLIKQKPTSDFIIAGGDFNITAYEEGKNKYFESLKGELLISHLEGCHECKGTNYFHPRKSWSFLDVLVFSKNFSDGAWALDKSSIRVFNTNLYQNNKWGSPMKFEQGRHQQGVSDHWPLMAEIFLNSSRSKGTFK